jgi:hypothetical protein
MSSLLWLPGAVAMPGLLLLLTLARTGNAATPRQRVDAFGLGMLLAPLLAPFAIVAPLASALPPAGATLASGWLESGLLEELAKALALWLVLAPRLPVEAALARAEAAILISLGFGSYENLLYLAGTGEDGTLLLVRSLVSLPAHFAAGIAAAAVLLARPNADLGAAAGAFAAAWFSHGTFNQWALAWAGAVSGTAAPEQVSPLLLTLLATAPVAGMLTVAWCWRRLLPAVGGGLGASLPWAVVAGFFLVAAWLFWDGLGQNYAARPAMIVLAMPFAALPAALALIAAATATDAWRCSVQVRGQREGGEVPAQELAARRLRGFQPGAALHLQEPADRALELERALPDRVELVRPPGRGDDQQPPVLVKHVDQGHEAPGLVAPGRGQDRDAGQEHDPEALGDRQIVGGPQRPVAQLGKVEEGNRPLGPGDP